MNGFFEIHEEDYADLPFLLFTIGESRKQESVWRTKGYGAHQFLWVTRGTGSFCIDGESFTLSEGEGVFFRAGVSNCYQGDPFSTRWFSFFINPAMLDHLGVGNVLRFSVPAWLDEDFASLHRFALGNSTPLSRSARGYLLVCNLFSYILKPNDTPATKILRMMESRFSEPLTLDDIAASVGIDRFRLCRYFLKETGSTVMDRLLHVRIEKAKHLLLLENESIGHVARLCGFESAAYFTKRFRQEVGCTPSEYRKQHSESV